MQSDRIGICLLGLGRAGTFHLQSLRSIDSARLVAVYDTDGSRAKSIADKFDCQAAESAFDAINLPSVDAVIVATPTDSHFDLIQMGLAAGKPVLTEKPLGKTLADVDRCFEQSKAKSIPLFVAFQRRFDPSFASLAQAVQSGAVGRLQFVRSVSRDNPVPSADYIRISGGIFHDCLVHDLDMVVHIVGETPTEMSAFASSFIPEIEALDDFDNVVASFRFPSGAVATIDINRKSAYGYDQRLEAFGDEGMLQVANHHIDSVESANRHGFCRSPIEFSFPSRYREAYLAELECFVRCVQGKESPPITHEDVRVNHLLASGAELAARQKRVVHFSEIERDLES